MSSTHLSGRARVGATTLFLMVMLGASIAGASTIKVLPLGSQSFEGNGENYLPFSCASLFRPNVRYQQAYRGSDLGVGTITELRFRQDQMGSSFSTTFSSIQVYLSSTGSSPEALSSSFAANRGADETLVYSGALPFSSNPSGAVPRPFDAVIPLQQDFDFDPSGNKNLLLEIVIGCKSTTAFDLQIVPGDGVGRVTSLSASATSGTPDSGGLPTAFVIDAAPASYSWEIGLWGECSEECGGGTQWRSVDCVDDASGQVVSDGFCDLPKPGEEQACNEDPCPTYSWQAGGWGQCSAECGGGTQTQTVQCVDDDTGLVVADSNCNPATRPPETQSCNEDPCPSYSWQQGGWGQCSAECGGGTQTQTVQCVDDNTGQVVADNNCNPSTRPPDSQSCNQDPCPTYSWQAGGWGQCSAECGGGTQTQNVQCVEDGSGQVVADSNCNPSTRPPETQSCNEDPCPTYYWQTGGWGQCSAECGGGTQTQTVQCIAEGSGQVVADSNCNPSTRPPDTQSCNEDPCPTYSWQEGGWGQCSAECGGGTQTQTVQCVADGSGQVVADSNCNPSTRPPDTQSCNEGPCYVWETGPWGQCSEVCGGGVQTRLVQCINEDNGQVRPDHFCSAPKPPNQQPCNTQTCQYHWYQSGWGICEESCTQSQVVECHDPAGNPVDPGLCSGPQPPSNRPCGGGECTAMIFGDDFEIGTPSSWSEVNP